MIQDLTTQAIQAALRHQWDQAITLNQKILQEKSQDCDALNRLAYAFMELGRYEESQEIFERVLVLDPRNLIATKNLLKVSKMLHGSTEQTNGNTPLGNHTVVDPNLFLEEPGKTKTCSLVRIAAKDVLSNLRIGYPVNLIAKNRSIAVCNSDQTCVGYLPDDLSFMLYRFMHAGNHYEAFIKSIADNGVTVFIRETTKSEEYQDIPSFMDTKKLHKHVTVPHMKPLEVEESFDTSEDESDADFNQE